MDQATWYYAVGNSQQQGPVDLATLQRLIAGGQVGPNDLVWRDGMADWVPASSVPELQVSTPSAVRTDPVQTVDPLPQIPQQTYAPPQYGNAPYPNAPRPYAPPQAADGGGFAMASMILGIVSIPGACIACIGFICSLLAIIFAVMNKNPIHAGKAKAGLICGIIGGVLSLVSSIIGVVMQLNR